MSFRYLLPTVALVLVGPACADPCVDDGLSQKDKGECPGVGHSGTESDTDATESNSNTMTASMSATQGTESNSGGTTLPTNGSGTESDTGGFCPVLDVLLTPGTPNIVLLVDQSSSMTAQFGNTTRWDAVRDTLVNPVDGIVTQLEAQIRFGLTLYTSFDGDQGGMCPVLTETSIALDNYAAIDSTFQMAVPEDETPTGESLSAVAATLAADPEPGPKVIILATDGEPDTCAEPNPQNGQAVAVTAAEDAYAAGIETGVISVGDQVSQQHLQDMANAGAGVGMNDPDAVFYQALDQQELLDAFNAIINGSRDCQLTMTDTIDTNQAQECDVTINDMPIPFEDPNGWQILGPNEIELQGTACDSIQEGDVEIKMICDCQIIT